MKTIEKILCSVKRPYLPLSKKSNQINPPKSTQEALANILGQTNKDYFILQHAKDAKKPSSIDENKAKKFFENTFLWN